jgi:hypothetical protein
VNLALLEVPKLRVRAPTLSYCTVDRCLVTAMAHRWAAGFPRFTEQRGPSRPWWLSAHVNGGIVTADPPGLDGLIFYRDLGVRRRGLLATTTGRRPACALPRRAQRTR